MLSFKEKRAIQKSIKSLYEQLAEAEGFKVKRALQKQIKQGYEMLGEDDVRGKVSKVKINQALIDFDKIKKMGFSNTTVFEEAMTKIEHIFDSLNGLESRNDRVLAKHAEILEYIEMQAKKFVKNRVLDGLKLDDPDAIQDIIDEIDSLIGNYDADTWADDMIEPLLKHQILLKTAPDIVVAEEGTGDITQSTESGGAKELTDQLRDDLSEVEKVLSDKSSTKEDYIALTDRIDRIEKNEELLESDETYKKIINLLQDLTSGTTQDSLFGE